MGPMCFDYGFGPFRWVCCSGLDEDLQTTDQIAASVLRVLIDDSPKEIRQQMYDNIQWIEQAAENQLVVGSRARILYADERGRRAIAEWIRMKRFEDGCWKLLASPSFLSKRSDWRVRPDGSEYRSEQYQSLRLLLQWTDWTQRLGIESVVNRGHHLSTQDFGLLSNLIDFLKQRTPLIIR